MATTPEQISKVPLFDGISDDERKQVATWFDVREFPAGAAITHEGASGYVFFVLSEGTVRVVHEHATLATLQPGDVFGELAILGDGRRRADAIAETDVVLLCMFGTHFRELQVGLPAVAQRIEAIAAKRRSEIAGT